MLYKKGSRFFLSRYFNYVFNYGVKQYKTRLTRLRTLIS